MSDGITDAQNTAGEMFGTERVMDLMLTHSQSSACELADAILASVSAFQRETERFDDETVVVLRVKVGEEPAL